MTARDVRDALHQACYVGLATEHEADFRINAFRAEVLREAADFVRDAHFRDGLSVQEIGTALRYMADAATPTSKEQRDGA